MHKAEEKKKHGSGMVLLCVLGVLLAVVCVHLAVFASRTEKEDIFRHDDLHSAVNVKDDGYQLDQVLIVSRHNIRSPLSGGDSLLSQVTPHEWFAWTSNSGELSVKGGQLETNMGQFFRKYLEAKGFMPENWRPKEGEVRFYANSMQRTIATAEYFASGMLPVGNPEIEYHKEYGEVDPIFCPIIQYNNPAFEAQVRAEISAMGGADGREYVRVFFCYGTTQQLRDCTITSVEDPPMFYELSFEGLQRNADGYYSFEDVMAKFDEALEHYYDYYEGEMQEAA